MKVFLLILLSTLILISGVWAAIGITVSGSWTLTIDATDLQSGAGSDLNNLYESATKAVSIDISGVGGKDTWRVDVKKTDTNWHSNFQLFVKRTSNGSGKSANISGGTTYQEVTDTDQSFFSGSGKKRNIRIQLKLVGVSVQIPQDIYTTTVTYTVVDT